MIDPRARIPEHSCMDVLNRVLSEQPDIDRIVIITLHSDGCESHLYTNTRSEPELKGMLFTALHCQHNLLEDDD